MRHRWPEDIRFTRVVLEVEDNVCGVCGGTLHICDHRRHRIFRVCPTYPTAVAMELQGTFGGPLPPGDKVNLGS
jgi:transposase